MSTFVSKNAKIATRIANVYRINADSKIIWISRRAGTSPRGSPLFAGRSSLAQNTSRNFLLFLAWEFWSLSFCAQSVVNVFSRNDSRAGEYFREIWRREKEKEKKYRKKKINTRDLHAFTAQVSAKFVLSRDERELRERVDLMSPSITSCLPRCRTGRGVLVSQRFPRGTGDGEVGGISRRRRFAREACARRHCATWGTPVTPLAPSASQPYVTRMEPPFSQVIRRMNRDRAACVAWITRRDAADVCSSVTVAITELWSYRVTKLQNTAAETHQVEKMESYFR